MDVYLNGTRIISATGCDITSSERFRIVTNHDWAIDNIVVDDTAWTPGIPPEIVVIVIAGAAVVIVTIVVFLRRR